MSGGENMLDLDGWMQVSCFERDQIRQAHEGLLVLSTLTDPDGVYGIPVTYTEWGRDDAPVLRDYLYRDPALCRHYAPEVPS